MKVAVVTGGNKGIGFSIVKGLCQQFNGTVYLTARDVNRGQTAVTEIEKLGLKCQFHQLDITDDESVNKFRDYLQNKYSGIDVLVNNAGIAFKDSATEPFDVQAKETMRVNYFSLKRVCHALFPLLKPHARVVNVASAYGHLSKIPGEEIRAKLSDANLTEEQLDGIMNDFVKAAAENQLASLGFGNSPYTVSKVGVSALTRIQQKKFDGDNRADLVVNAIHPGYVDTDLTDHKGIFTPDRGAQTPIYAALLPENTPIKGKFLWHDCTPVDWIAGPLPVQ